MWEIFYKAAKVLNDVKEVDVSFVISMVLMTLHGFQGQTPEHIPECKKRVTRRER